MKKWVCYLIRSLDSQMTYVGASNDQPNRLENHNESNPNIKRKGAKRTAGQTWVPVLIISGFPNKNACLSFESGWKRLSRKRSNKRFDALNILMNNQLRYQKNPTINRILDLLYFMHSVTFIGKKYMINYDMRHPVCIPSLLTINYFDDTYYLPFYWPPFVETKKIDI